MMFDLNNIELETRKKIASNENTPADILEKLSNDFNPEVRQAVASNPNTPVVFLEILGKEFPEAITANPMFSLLLLENPENHFIKLSLARSSTTSGETLKKLAETEDRDILCAIASNVNIPEDTLSHLTRKAIRQYDFDYNLCYEITKNSNTPDRILENLIDKSLNQIHEANLFYADNVYTIDSIERECLQILLAVVAHPNVSASILEKLAHKYGYEPQMMLALAKNVKTLPSTLEKIAACYQRDARCLRNKDIGKDIVNAILANPNVSKTAIQISHFIE